MSEPKDLLLLIEQLRRSNRRWKALALAACSALVLVAIVGFVVVAWAQILLEREQRVALDARARAEVAAAALRGANPGKPR